MTTVKILGIDGSSQTEQLRTNVQAALNELGVKAVVEHVFGVDELMKYKINGIPALVVNDTVVLQKKVPLVEDLKILLKVFLESSPKPVTMKRIVVPTDFSNVSKSAFQFAQDLVSTQDSKLLVINAYHPEYDPQNPYLLESATILIENTEGRLHEFAKADGERSPAPLVEEEVVIGFPVEEILRASKKFESDMIIMGTRGDKGIFEKMFGSVSINVAQEADCPVMLIPEGVEFKGFRHILYASDYGSADEKQLRQLIEMAKLFKADVHFVHVNEDGIAEDYKEIERRLFRILFDGGEPDFSFTMSKIEGNSVTTGLNKYASEHEIDLVVLVRPQRSFWESLFHKSLTKSMVFNSSIPILVLHQRPNDLELGN